MTISEPRILTTTEGDTIDEICNRHYGQTANITEKVIVANPHLLTYSARLPAGLSITLPVFAPEPQRHIRLW